MTGEQRAINRVRRGIKAQADIVPIALVDTFDLLPMNTYHIKCQPLEMRVGEVISTTGLTLRDTRVPETGDVIVAPGLEFTLTLTPPRPAAQ